MTTDQQLDYRTLIRDYMVANTPFYLYSHFRRDSSVRTLARETDTGRLVAQVSQLISGGIEDIQDLVSVYASVIALTFKPYSQVREFFSGLDEPEVQWLNDIRRIYLISALPETTYDVPIPQGRVKGETAPSSATMTALQASGKVVSEPRISVEEDAQ
jgi:hypothetical protein